MIPLRDENPSRTVPVVTRFLILANVVAFVYTLGLGQQVREFAYVWGTVPARLTLALSDHSEPVLSAAVPLFTSMFLHGGIAHLLGNMWYLWIFGDNVEDRLGHFGFLMFYLAAGLAAGITHVVFNPTSRVPAVGASGAIAGVLGSYLVAFPRARVVTLIPFFPFIQIIALPAAVVLGLWFVFQFFSGALSLAWSPREAGGVAWWAHIGGFVVGVVVMPIFGRGTRSRAEIEG